MSNIASNFNKWVRDEEWKNTTCCATPEIVYCRDCVHRPRKRWICDDYEIAPPQGTNDRVCPFIRPSTPWDRIIPNDCFYCAYGERKEK